MVTYNRTSTAHALAHFESYADRAEKDEKAKIKIKEGTQSLAKSGSVFKIVVVAFCAVALPIWILMNKAELSELSGKISLGAMELEQLESETLRLQAELDNLVTLAAVEEFAKNELGMQKITIAQGRYISIDTGSTVEVAQNKNDPANFISEQVSNILEFFGFK